jgi:phosphatidate cytidylyltransferase
MSSVEHSPADKPAALSNLTLRLITAFIALPIALYAAYVDGWLMLILVTLIAVVGATEFYVLAQGREVQGSTIIGVPTVIGVILGFYLGQSVVWLGTLILGAGATFILEMIRHPQQVRRSLLQVVTTVAGVVYVGFPLAFLVAVRSLPDGLMWSLLVFIITWGTDTFAYFGGRLWGKTQLAPTLSPKKSVEGAIVGIVGAIVLGAIWLVLHEKLSLAASILIGIGPLVAIMGDLLESAIKRFFHVKDSHIAGLDILPGHGGVLDRIDSLLLVSTFTYFFLVLTGTA